MKGGARKKTRYIDPWRKSIYKLMDFVAFAKFFETRARVPEESTGEDARRSTEKEA